MLAKAQLQLNGLQHLRDTHYTPLQEVADHPLGVLLGIKVGSLHVFRYKLNGEPVIVDDGSWKITTRDLADWNNIWTLENTYVQPDIEQVNGNLVR